MKNEMIPGTVQQTVAEGPPASNLIPSLHGKLIFH